MPRMLIILLALTFEFTWNATASAEDRELDSYIVARIAEFEKIPADRRKTLAKLTAYLQSRHTDQKLAQMTFICTHNSRRSQMAQVWASVAAARYGVSDIKTFSGGTEQTAFNPRAVAALKRAGVPIRQLGGTAQNPEYEVKIGSSPLTCFSKIYNQSPNPDSEFVAIMTCSEADKKCPIVSGAQERIALPYEDPKASDGTEGESRTYDERCAQIAREMLFVFSGVRHLRSD